LPFLVTRKSALIKEMLGPSSESQHLHEEQTQSKLITQAFTSLRGLEAFTRSPETVEILVLVREGVRVSVDEGVSGPSGEKGSAADLPPKPFPRS
jgi:hypothetical protein